MEVEDLRPLNEIAREMALSVKFKHHPSKRLSDLSGLEWTQLSCDVDWVTTRPKDILWDWR